MDKYVDVVWDMMGAAYKKLGGLKGVSSKEDLIASTDIWKLVRRNGKIVACSLYSTKRGGRKTIGGCSDGSDTGKQGLYDIMKEDIKQLDRSAWAEVSGAIEHKMLQFGAIKILAKDAQKIIPDKPFLSINFDGYHYTRLIGGTPHEKIMLGNVVGISGFENTVNKD